MLKDGISIEVVDEMKADLDGIPFEFRDRENLIRDFIDHCGYTMSEAIEAANNVEH